MNDWTVQKNWQELKTGDELLFVDKHIRILSLIVPKVGSPEIYYQWISGGNGKKLAYVHAFHDGWVLYSGVRQRAMVKKALGL